MRQPNGGDTVTRRRGSPDATQGQYMGHGHEVKKPSRRRNKNVASTLKFLLLLPLWRTTIRDAWPQHGPIAQPTGLIENLSAQFASRSNNQDQRLGADSINGRIEAVCQVWAAACQLLDPTHEFGDGRDQISSGFSRPWNEVREYRSRRVVADHQSEQRR